MLFLETSYRLRHLDSWRYDHYVPQSLFKSWNQDIEKDRVSWLSLLDCLSRAQCLKKLTFVLCRIYCDDPCHDWNWPKLAQLLREKQGLQVEIVLLYKRKDRVKELDFWRSCLKLSYPHHLAIINRIRHTVEQALQVEDICRARCTIRAVYESHKGAWQVLGHIGEDVFCGPIVEELE